MGTIQMIITKQTKENLAKEISKYFEYLKYNQQVLACWLSKEKNEYVIRIYLNSENEQKIPKSVNLLGIDLPVIIEIFHDDMVR